MLKMKDLTKHLLVERTEGVEKCCVLFNVSERIAKPLTKLGRLIREEDLHEYGIEREPHVTGLYGITPTETVLQDTQQVLKQFPKSAVTAKLGECSLFQNSEFDVLKFDVFSPDLNDVNDLLTKNVDYTNDFTDYHPHLTIAYLKPGAGEKYVNKINNSLRGYPLEFGPPIFSDQNQKHTSLILGYPDNENAKHPDTGQMNEDLGWGSGNVSSGMPYMSGHMGVYNSPDTRVPRTAAQYARYNMTNNNTVVSSGYYDTIFDADIKKVMMILTELGFKVEKYQDTDEYSIQGGRRADQTHTQTNQSNVVSSDDVMNDTSGINLGKDAILKYLNQEVGKEDVIKYQQEQEEEVTYDEIKTGLDQVMRHMKYPDKDFATMEVIKTLMKDPKYYSGLGKYNLNEIRQIKGTNMKADCKVNTKELGSIVRNMLAEKNQVGRQAFELMQTPMDENINEYDPEAIEEHIENIFSEAPDDILHVFQMVIRGIQNGKIVEMWQAEKVLKEIDNIFNSLKESVDKASVEFLNHITKEHGVE